MHRRARSTVVSAVLVLVTSLLALAGPAGLAAASPAQSAPATPTRGADGVATLDVRIPVRDGPARDQPQTLDATLYLPPSARGPAMLVAHGFGGSKDSVASEARRLAARGYVTLAWTARGFGDSTGQIALDSPDYEVADASQLVDWLAARPEVVLDAPGDPRIGVTGGSYGGALALLLAGYDRRIDATVPVITWNDLGQALFPNAATTTGPAAATPAVGANSGDGVFKRGWAGVFFGTPTTGSGGSGGSGGSAGDGAASRPDVCGRFLPEICAGYVEAARTGREPAALGALLAQNSPATIAGRITAPTLLVQGEQDTLFGLDQADATARGIAGAGGRVAVAWFAGGHDGGSPDTATQARMDAWLDHFVLRTAPDPGSAFTYALPSGVQSRRTPTQRTVDAPVYPGLPGTPAAQRLDLRLTGEPQQVLAPAGATPSSISSVPGLSALAGGGGSDDGGSGGGGSGGGGGGTASALLGRLAADLPGQAATFRTDPVAARTVVSGSPQVRLSVAAVPGQPATGDAVLFGKVYDVAPGAGGSMTLLGNAVAPMRVPLAPDGTPATVTVTLPGVVATLAEGHRLEVAVATTDQAYASSVAPAVYRIALADAASPTLAVPTVAGDVRSGTTVPLGPIVAALVLLAGVAVAVVIGRIVAARRRRRDTEPGGDLAVDPELQDVPLVVRGVAKAFPSGVRAVDDVTFRVERGQVLGLLGPNGAGKTTTLRMLMGLIRPSAGELRVFGVRVAPGAPVLGRIGSFVEGAGFLPHLSGRANLELYWAATGRPLPDAHLDEALTIAGLGTAVERRVRTYSQGMRQRLAIAQAMLGLPDLLVLDEPTNGLDPPQIHAMRDVLRSYATGGAAGRGGGRTVLVSSHLLAEVEQTCDHVVVMHRGRVVASGEVAELVAGGQIALTVTPGGRDTARAALAGLDVGVADDAEQADVLVVDLRDTERATVVRAVVEAGGDVVALGPRRRLEDAFLALIGEETTP